MKNTEHPILFSTPMVQSIEEGLKDQTRRIINPQPDDSGLHNHSELPMYVNSPLEGWHGTDDLTGEDKAWKCRYGKKGDLLWVRETWRKLSGDYIYKANHWNPDTKNWKPSIHLPKVATRIWLKNIGVGVERVQQISEEDCKREGVFFDKDSGYYFVRGTEIIAQSYYEGFQKLWIEVNGQESWDSNPWVWVISFEKHKK
jgi:hypothetical protein